MHCIPSWMCLWCSTMNTGFLDSVTIMSVIIRLLYERIWTPFKCVHNALWILQSTKQIDTKRLYFHHCFYSIVYIYMKQRAKLSFLLSGQIMHYFCDLRMEIHQNKSYVTAKHCQLCKSFLVPTLIHGMWKRKKRHLFVCNSQKVGESVCMYYTHHNVFDLN